MFEIDRKAVWSKMGLVLVGLTLLFGVLTLIFGEWVRADRYIPREKVWEAVQLEAVKYDLDPKFVFAIVAAESSFNAHARNGDARGLMQLRPIAWKEVSETSHRRAWKWRQNIAVGTAYLANLKEFLEEHGEFSYPKLAACYRHGPHRVKGVGFRLEALPEPSNEIYRKLQQGDF